MEMPELYEKKNKKKIKKIKKPLHLQGFLIIMASVVTLIALKREVAADSKRRFSVERMSSYRNWRQVTVQYRNVRISRKHRVRI